MATYTDKLNRILTAIGKTTGLINILPGSKAYQLAEAVAYEQMQLEYNIEDYAAQNSILFASGSDLNRIGETFFNVRRLSASAPFVTSDMKAIKFYVANGTFGNINYDAEGTSRIGKDILLYEGTLVSGTTADGVVVMFRTTEPYVLAANKSEAYVSAELVRGQYDIIQAGILKTHNFSNYTQFANKLLLVTNPTIIATGRTEETDDNYRYRLTNALKAFPKTTSQGIIEAVTSLSDVSSATLLESSNGGGTFDIFVQGVSPITSDQTIENVNIVLQDIVGPWISYNVLKPYYVGLQIGITITVSQATSNQDAVIQQVQDNIAYYINNSFQTEFFIRDLLTIATQAHADVTSASFSLVREHFGHSDARKYIDIDYTSNPNYSLIIGSTEKLIVEPVSNAITVTI